jgi:hypothetical protein
MDDKNGIRHYQLHLNIYFCNIFRIFFNFNNKQFKLIKEQFKDTRLFLLPMRSCRKKAGVSTTYIIA